MYYNQTKQAYVIIGTVIGGGYNCAQNETKWFEGSSNGIWNKVSAWMGWIKKQMRELDDDHCSHDLDKSQNDFANQRMLNILNMLN